jgi:hypothetical protein
MNKVFRVRISRQRRRVRRSAIHVSTDLISITSFEFMQTSTARMEEAVARELLFNWKERTNNKEKRR